MCGYRVIGAQLSAEKRRYVFGMMRRRGEAGHVEEEAEEEEEEEEEDSDADE